MTTGVELHTELEGVPPPLGFYSHAASVQNGVGRTAYLSGQIPVDMSGELVGVGDFRRQVHQTFDNIQRVLAGLGSSFEQVVYVRSFLTRVDDLAAYTEERKKIYAQVCPKGPPPTTTVYVDLYHPDCLLEVEVVAVVSGEDR